MGGDRWGIHLGHERINRSEKGKLADKTLHSFFQKEQLIHHVFQVQWFKKMKYANEKVLYLEYAWN